MPKKLMLMLLAVFALAACDKTANLDEGEFDRQQREVFRQLGGS